MKEWVFGGECETPIHRRCTATPAACAGQHGCGRSNIIVSIPRGQTGENSGAHRRLALLDGKHFIQAAIPQPVDLLNLDLHRNALFHGFNVAYHADDFTAGVERIQRIERGIQRFAVQGAKTFIKEQ